MALEIHRVRTARQKKAFLRVPFQIQGRDPFWVPALDREQRGLLDVRKNPFFEYGEAEFFVAWCDGVPVGRISAQIDRRQQTFHGQAAGFFGFFDAPHDHEVAMALWSACEIWLLERGQDLVVGPYNLNINGVCGVLIDGFDAPPYLYMGHNPRYYADLCEYMGLGKAKDLFAWRYRVGDLPEETRKIAESSRLDPGLRVRPIDRRNLERDVHIVQKIFNEAWSSNWGFLPLTNAEMRSLVADLKLIIDPSIVLIAEVDGEPAGIAVALPDLNHAIRDLDGRLFPFGFAKMAWRISRKKIDRARLMLLGILPEYRSGPRVQGLVARLLADSQEAWTRAGYLEIEASWTLEDNDKVNRAIRLLGGERYKTYRLYSKALG